MTPLIQTEHSLLIILLLFIFILLLLLFILFYFYFLFFLAGTGIGFQPGAGHRRQLGPGGLGDEEVSTLGLGELAQLTVNNEAEAAYDVRVTFCMLNIC